MEIPKNTKDEIWDYCRHNNITNIDEFTLKLIKQGFTVEKFGATPVTQAKIVEKIVEVPVETIVEKVVERIVEVPVEVNDKELTKKYKDLQKQNEKLLTEVQNIKSELEIEKKRNKKDIYGE